VILLQYSATLRRHTLPNDFSNPLAYYFNLGDMPFELSEVEQLIRAGRDFIVESTSPSSRLMIFSTVKYGFKQAPKVLHGTLTPKLLAKGHSHHWLKVSLVPYGPGLTDDLVLWLNRDASYVLASRSGRSLDRLASIITSNGGPRLRIDLDQEHSSRLTIRERRRPGGKIPLPDQAEAKAMAVRVRGMLPSGW